MVFIDSKKLYNAYIHGAIHVMRYKSVLNRINVFPVPDGDTGNNLHSTMRSIINESTKTDSVKTTMESIADASLGGARGNSGIIFSQYLNGVSMEISDGNAISISDFVIANKKSVDYAYNAVSNPIEGTMLTVIRDWADSLFDFHTKAANFQELLAHGYNVIENSLMKTKQQLSVLRKANVVDAGAKGFVLFIKGFVDYFITGKKSEIIVGSDTMNEKKYDIHLNTEYRYCVEAKVAGCSNTEKLRDSLNNVGGSVIVAGNTRVARIHIHTNNPRKVFEVVGVHEEIISQKVEDMKLQSDIIENRKFSIALITDSIADIPDHIIDNYQIFVVPINIISGEDTYLDKLTISNKKILQDIDNKEFFPTTSVPDIKSVENTLSYLNEYFESIIAITVSSGLSGTYNVFNKAAKKLISKGANITIIDSKQNSGAQGLIVLKCAKKIAEGKSHNKIVNEIEEIVPKSKIIVSVSNLKSMIKGGRLSTRAGKIAGKLNLKPIVTLDKEGKGTLGGAAFSQKGSRKKIIHKVKSLHKKKKLESYSVVYIDDEDYAKDIAADIMSQTGIKADFIVESSSVIAISAGRGAVALSYITK